MHKNWNAIVEFSVRKKFLLSRKIIIMQKVFFVLVLELDGFFQKFCIVPLSKISQNLFKVVYVRDYLDKEHYMVCF